MLIDGAGGPNNFKFAVGTSAIPGLNPENPGLLAFRDRATEIETDARVFPWYALKVRTGGEARLGINLEQKGFEIFLPTWLEIRRYSDRLKKIQSPMFPGYLFCRLDVNRRQPVLTTTGVEKIVSFGGEPCAVPEKEIEAIQRALTAGKSVVPWPYLQTGDAVIVQFGPLTGVEGLVVRADGKDRIVLSVNLLQRSVAVQIDRDQIRPLARSFAAGK